jgi:hypothetical protein
MVGRGCGELTGTIRAAGLGPVAVVETIRATSGTPETVRVVLDSDCPGKGRLLQRWLTVITVVDMVMGQYRSEDERVQLNLRGRFSNGVPVILVAPFHFFREQRQVKAITVWIEGQRVRGLVDLLAGMEAGAGEQPVLR